MGHVIATGEPVTIGRVEKMSKSKKNTVDPGPILDRYGADAVRWFMLSDSPPERDLPWSIAGIEGCARFTQRLWRASAPSGECAGGADDILARKLHRTIAGVADDIESLSFNKAVAKLYELVGAVEKAAPSATRDEAARALVVLAAPMVPHLAEEAWARAGGEGLVADAPWPTVDPDLCWSTMRWTIAIQVNGKLRDTLSVAKGAPRETIEALALAAPKVQSMLDGKPPRKVIVVPRSFGEHRRMTSRCVLTAMALALSVPLAGCGLHPLYGGGGAGLVAATLGAVEVGAIAGKEGWLVRTALLDRLGASGRTAARYRLEVELDDRIIGFGVRTDNTVSRERRTLRARYKLVDPGTGTVLLDATAGSDAGIDVVRSEYAVIAAEQTALERLSNEVSDQIVARLALFAARTGPAESR